MKKNKINLFVILISALLSLVFVNAVQDFSVNPNSFSQTVNTDGSNTGVISITNTGNESINLTISKEDLSQSSVSDIVINLNDTSIENLAQSETADISFNYTAGSDDGDFTGSIIVENTDNSSQNETISIDLTVNSVSTSEYNIEFENEGSVLDMEIDIDDDKEAKTFRLVNIGNQRIDDIEIDLDRLDGDDDEIDEDEIEINGEEADNTYEFDEDFNSDFGLEPGESVNVKIEIDIPSNLDVDDYRGDLEVSYLLANGTSESREFTLNVDAKSDDEDVYFEENLYMSNAEIELELEAGEFYNDLEIEIRNEASYDIENLSLRFDGDLEEEDSTAIISKDRITFKESPFDIYDDDTEEINVEIDIPDDQPTGTYIADLDLLNSDGNELDTIVFKIKIVGDVYIKDLVYDDEIDPGEDFDLDVTVKNQGSKSLNTIQIYATLFDIDYGNSDITESTSTFILNAGDEKTKTLRFDIPEEASDGSHTLQVRVRYDGDELTETEELIVNRPNKKIVIESFGINPKIAKCNKELYTFIKFKNLGKYDEDIQVITKIEGTNVEESSTSYELNVDASNTESQNLNIENLEAEEYSVIHQVNAGGSVTEKISKLTILECGTDSNGLDVEDLNNQTEYNQTTEKDNTFNIFNKEIDKFKVYLSGGLIVVLVAIIGTAIFLL